VPVRYRRSSASALGRRGRRTDDQSDDLPLLLGARAKADPSRLGHADVLRLQRLAGNQAVARMAAQHAKPKASASDETIHGRSESAYAFEIVVPRRSGRAASLPPAFGEGRPRRDRLAADSAEPGEEPVEKIDPGGHAYVEESDAVAPALTYSGAVGARATPPNASLFGVTSTDVKINGVQAVPGAGGTFKVTGAVAVSAKWSVHSRGRIDVPYYAAPVVTATTYPKVASDLTPNMSSDGGRPPRRSYWAKDLTERHEQFHANERTGKYGKAAFDFATAWLAAQTASTPDEAKDLANQVPDKMFESYDASFAPGKENRAYGDGAIAYQVRADMAKAYGEELKKNAAKP
jgi:hypothetical protein